MDRFIHRQVVSFFSLRSFFFLSCCMFSSWGFFVKRKIVGLCWVPMLLQYDIIGHHHHLSVSSVNHRQRHHQQTTVTVFGHLPRGRRRLFPKLPSTKMKRNWMLLLKSLESVHRSSLPVRSGRYTNNSHVPVVGRGSC